MKRLRYLLFALLLIIPLSGCASFGDTIPDAPRRTVVMTTYDICFVNAYTGYMDCGWYPYSTFGMYYGHFDYYNRGNRHYFWHYNWIGHSGVRVAATTPIRQGRMIKGKGYTQYKETPNTGRTAIPRGQATPSTPQTRSTPQAPPAQRRAVPREQTRPPERVTPPSRTAQPKVSPPQRSAPPKMRTPTHSVPPKATPPKRVVKPRGGGGGA